MGVAKFFLLITNCKQRIAAALRRKTTKYNKIIYFLTPLVSLNTAVLVTTVMHSSVEKYERYKSKSAVLYKLDDE